jgi:hypothetical protein
VSEPDSDDAERRALCGRGPKGEVEKLYRMNYAGIERVDGAAVSGIDLGRGQFQMVANFASRPMTYAVNGQQ